MKPIEFELFERIINNILEHDKKLVEVSDILCSENNGFVDFGSKLTDVLLDLLKKSLDIDEDDDILEWWIWSGDENDKFVYVDSEEDKSKQICYDLNSLQDLYNYLTKDYKNVKQKDA